MFTEPGRMAIQRFEEERASSVRSFSNYLSSLSEGEMKLIDSFLSHMEEFLAELE